MLITIVRHEQRVKSTVVGATAYSLLERFPLYTTLPLEDRIQNKYSESIENHTKEKIYLKRILRKLAFNFDLFSTKPSRVFQFSAFKHKIQSKMKDLVNGNILIENNDDLIGDQKYAYSNGVR